MRGEASDHSDYGFQIPSPGEYKLTITEGIKVYENEERGTQSLQIPFRIAEGEFEGSQLSIFISMDEKAKKFSEDRVASLMKQTGTWERFMQKFPGDISPLDPAIINQIKIAFNGKTVIGKVTNTTTKDGKTYANIQETWKLGSSPNSKPKSSPAQSPKPAAQPTQPKPQAAEQSESSDTDNWDD